MSDEDVRSPDPEEVVPTDNSTGAPIDPDAPKPADADEGKAPEDISAAQIV
ncbi:MAG TPA: hypothetical protein VD931_17140 [Baekduia sp.]|nr:hypothetical protein [Baekduia sp.]